MKRVSLLTLICLLLLPLLSCVPSTTPPMGIWRSENPNITLYVNFNYRASRNSLRYPGVYIKNDIITKVFVDFGNGPRFTIFEMSALGDGVLYGDKWLFIGTFRVRNDKLHYTLTQAAQERTGYDVIIFYKLEDYDPINPEDWLPSN